MLSNRLDSSDKPMPELLLRTQRESENLKPYSLHRLEEVGKKLNPDVVRYQQSIKQVAKTLPRMWFRIGVHDESDHQPVHPHGEVCANNSRRWSTTTSARWLIRCGVEEAPFGLPPSQRLTYIKTLDLLYWRDNCELLAYDDVHGEASPHRIP